MTIFNNTNKIFYREEKSSEIAIQTHHIKLTNAQTQGQQEKKRGRSLRNIPFKTAATYSPTIRSTIGAGGLNFSVRNGKRWNPAAIAT